ncbi:Ppx/GppA phosphatase family protein [Massilia sp. W12]|uniref:Ppx/GppA phosphatase family protein n=1 Tax=Massilia sp. W12 TaxID=3126507 RepID=UPI0030CF1072
MFAAIDLGSNSFRMHIASHDGQSLRIVKSTRDQIRLAGGLDAQSNLSEQAIAAALQSLSGFGQILRGYPLTAARVVGTNTLRVAKNVAQFLPLAEKAVGYPIEIISGEEEGRLIYMGVAHTLANDAERRLVIDIGGGSTELITGLGHEIKEVESFTIGTFSQAPAFFPDGRLTQEGFEAAILSARSHFQDYPAGFAQSNWQNAYGSSGTIRALAEIISKNGIGSGLLNLHSMRALIQRFIQFGHLHKVEMQGLRADRVSAVVGGLAVLTGLCEEIGIALVNPIEAGLRMGVLWDLYLRSTKQDRREHSITFFMQKFNVDAVRAKSVAEQASLLLAKTKPASDALEKPLFWAGLLHEVGMNISHTNYHKHSAYIIEHADLSGFTTREQKLMARLALGQKGNLRKLGDVCEDLEFVKALLALRLAVIFLHSHLEIQLEQLRIRVKNNRIELEFAQNWLHDHPTASYWLDKEHDWWGQIGLDLQIKSAA